MRVLATTLSLLLALSPCVQAANLVAPRVVRATPSLRLAAPALTHSTPAALPTLTTSLKPVVAPAPASPGLATLVPVIAPTAAEAPWAGATPEQSAVLETRFAELGAAFDVKKAELGELGSESAGVPSLAPSTGGGDEQKPPEPPKKRDDGGGRRSKGWWGFARPAAFLLVAMGIAQIGLEAQAAAMPPLIAKIFGDVTISADLGIIAAVADIAGTVMAPAVIKKLGLRGAYVGSTVLKLTTAGVIAGMLAAGWMTLPLMMGLYAVESVLYGVSYTSEKSIPAVLLNQDQGKLERFRAARQIMIEVVATLVPVGAGALVAAAGFLPALIAFPASAALAIGLVALTLKLPAKLQAASELPSGFTATAGNFFKSIARGTVIVAKTPALAWSMAAYAFYYLMNPLLYWLIAPAFGIWVAGGEAKGAFIQGILTGAFSLGGLLAGLFIMRREPKDLRRSMLRSMDLAAVTILGVALFALGVPWIAAGVLLVFGVAHVLAKIKLESFFQARAPADHVDDVTAVLEAFASIVTALGLYALKLLLGAAPGAVGFAWLAGAIFPLALILWILRRGLSRSS